MIRVSFDPTNLTGADLVWWKAWEVRVKSAHGAAVAYHTSPNTIGAASPATIRGGSSGGARRNGATGFAFDETIWRDLKRKLLEWAFHGKCAYCESLIVDATDNPAAEHFRPKNAPTVLNTAGKQEEVRVNGVAHPGYFWLAYDWRNLVPACSQCNSNYKGNLFPVRKVHVAAYLASRSDPMALDALEEPLLLHPYFDDPEKHLRFGDYGVVAAVNGDDRGEASIKTYGLMREGLRSEREEKQHFVWLDVSNALASNADPKAIMRPYHEGRKPYSRAVLDYVIPRIKQKIADLESALTP